MKKLVSLFAVLFFLSAILMTGCKKEENVDNNFTNPKVVVKDGILKFADEEAMQSTLNYLAHMTEKEADNWEKQIGFHSIQRYRTEAEHLIIDNIDKLINSGYKVDELQKKVLNGELNDIPQAAKNIIDLCGFKVRTNEDNTRELYIPVKSSVNFRLLNADYMYAIGNQIHCFKDDYELISKEWNKNFANLKSTNDYLIQNKIVQLSNLETTDSIYNKQHGTLYAQRVIYWSTYEKDPWTHIKLYIEFYAAYKKWYWFTWKPQSITVKGDYYKMAKWRDYVVPLAHYSNDMDTTIQSPYILYEKWAFDGDFPWFAFKDADYTLRLTDNPSVKIDLVQLTGSNISPCYLYNKEGGITYDRTNYDNSPRGNSPGDMH